MLGVKWWNNGLKSAVGGVCSGVGPWDNLPGWDEHDSSSSGFLKILPTLGAVINP